MIPILRRYIYTITISTLAFISTTGCDKMVELPDAIDAITTEKVFSNDKTAEYALMSIYSQMANGSGSSTFTGGLLTRLAMESADEYMRSSFNYVVSNQLTAQSADATDIGNIWRSCYSIGVYGSNAMLEGLKEASNLSPDNKARIEGESKFLRAFSYFYLTNFFGDVPLALSTNFNETAYLPKTSKSKIYQQMVSDLKDAQRLLPRNFAINNGLRIRANKWAATALLARVYLYLGEYENAAKEADAVITETALFSLMTDLNSVFSTSSKEAIWQLQHHNASANGNATPEANDFTSIFLYPKANVDVGGFISTNLMNAFEANDQRKTAWTFYTYSGTDTSYHLYKYKTGAYNKVVGGLITEYYTPLRLAEQYLIRAEASFKANSNAKSAAIDDLNAIRHRAGLDSLPSTLNNIDVEAAIEKEWRMEYFMEWGHRWLNLKRTGRATAVLSAIPYKQPWLGDHQLEYPIPLSELVLNPHLTLQEGYK